MADIEQPTSPDTPATDAATGANAATPKRLPTALVYDPAFLEHHVPDDFPETAARLRGALAVIDETLARGVLPEEHVARLTSRRATADELAAVHAEAYIERFRQAAEATMEGQGFDAEPRTFGNEVYISPGSYDAALKAAGAPLVALDAIGEGSARNGYALVRPPGHHARPNKAMGFCIFNNIAVAARYAQARWGWKKVLIVDYDVHHGNGTQEMFYADPSVVYFSMHQFPWYPGTGASSERGAGEGVGATVNVPLPAGSGWSVYDSIVRQVLWPLADRERPDVILVSAGYDAHWLDPLGEMRLSVADFSDMSLELLEMAERYCGGRIVFVQEGGYSLDAVAQCATTVLVNCTGNPGIIDSLGEAPPLDFRWNDEAIINALYELHGLAGYRRKARRVREAQYQQQAQQSAHEHGHEHDEE